MSAGQSGEDRRSLQSGLGQSGPMTARVPRMCGLGDTVKFFGTINPLVFIWQEHIPPLDCQANYPRRHPRRGLNFSRAGSGPSGRWSAGDQAAHGIAPGHEPLVVVINLVNPIEAPRRLQRFCRSERRSWSRILFMPCMGVPSHSQPLISHLAPVFLLNCGTARLSFPTAFLRMGAKLLSLGDLGHFLCLTRSSHPT